MRYEFRRNPKRKKQVIYEPISFIHFALGWTSFTHWRVVCITDSIGLRPSHRLLLIEKATIGLWTAINCYG